MRAKLTRRAFAGQGASSVALLSGLARGAETGPVNHDVAKGKGAAGGPPINALTDKNLHFQIDVMINSQGPFSFVVDTGADRTVLAEDVAQRLGLAPRGGVIVQGTVRTIPAATVDVGSLSFGRVLRSNITLPVLPRELLAADGYLGLDSLDGYCMTIDFIHHSIEIEDSGSSRAKTLYLQESTVSAVGAYGHLKALSCSVDDVSATAFIDSGSEVTIGNAALERALHDRNKDLRSLRTVQLTGVTGGMAEGRLVSIERVRLGHISFLTKAIVIADLQLFDVWKLNEGPALLIGMNYLNTFSRVSIDYGVRQFRFELAAMSAFERAYSRT